ncbi:MAG TPA: cell division protein SepF [Stackebrandtia sp.]|uniref:cell division protein SepF n=1 Tax=Stackebrandtia sp. TaxID=2023065 RepID=UPI002D2AC5AB|nr:cell division protein SepF [Stackebrandtia sp.]HZE38154.1 cell division protein SepF [Stackebrandtia sp.]
MGAMRKAGVWLGLIEDDEDRQFDEFDDSDEFDDRADRASSGQSRVRRLDRTDRSPERSKVRHLSRPSSSVTSLTRDNLALAPEPMSRERPVLVTDNPDYRITTVHPTTYNEARTVGEAYRDGTPVIMNLTELDEADAKRLVDFAAGLVFGTRGSFDRVTNRVFLLSPANIQVTAEDKARIADGGFFNQS